MNTTRKLLSAPLEQLLISGSDTRASVDAHTGLNPFGCTPIPRPEALSFGSSTASSISKRAFHHVQQEHARFLEAEPSVSFSEQVEKLRGTVKELLGIGPALAEVVFSPSGTDSTLYALFVARALSGPDPLDCLLTASDETGSGVPCALAGRHFSTLTAEGVVVPKGRPITGLSENVTLVPIPRRTADGVQRTPAEMDQAVFAAAAHAAEAGHRVLLQTMDCSKLGVRSPSLACLRRIQECYPEAVTVVVDACQMRISRARLQGHLAQGHLVLISGSKFFTGPPFSGALLIPAAYLPRLTALREIPSGFRDYTHRCAWPQAWTSLQAVLPDRTNVGQFFRWTAAVEEMRAYYDVPEEFRRTALQQFARLAAECIQRRAPDLLLLDEWAYGDEGLEEAEMGARTIFPFLLRQGEGWMSFEDTIKLNHLLNQDIAAQLPESLPTHERALAAKLCHIGQPVRLAMGARQNAGALRLCASARTVTHAWTRHPNTHLPLSLQQEYQEIKTVLDKIALITRHFASLIERNS